VDVLLTIGELSKMTELSVKALRHEHDVGGRNGLAARRGGVEQGAPSGGR
jgi:hypothetical protein